MILGEQKIANQDFSTSYYCDKAIPTTLEFTPPGHLLTTIEWGILFLILTRILDKKLTRSLFQEQSFGAHRKQLRGGTGYGQVS
ncbi:hypothetical protein [Xenorhabdus ishibashii]|uniref:hypothetical protein n=1 Tax=Xenorhabdus ishibashii TaxID=1034471 RepID=UPI00142E69A6|nr:hypothetical protein [Xenorhabdus ishibashii]